MVLNPEKCHYMCVGKDYVKDSLSFFEEVLGATELETVLGIKIDNKLNFENHIKFLCGKGTLQRDVRDVTKILKSVRCAREKSSVRFYNEISVQLLSTCLDVLLKKIKFSIFMNKLLELFMMVIAALTLNF